MKEEDIGNRQVAAAGRGLKLVSLADHASGLIANKQPNDNEIARSLLTRHTIHLNNIGIVLDTVFHIHCKGMSPYQALCFSVHGDLPYSGRSIHHDPWENVSG